MKKILRNFIIYICAIQMALTNVFAEEIDDEILEINAKSHILIDMDTGFVIDESNPDRLIYPASTTKIMTALIVLENTKLNDLVYVGQESLEGLPTTSSSAKLKVGEIMSVEDMLYCLLLPSGNDAANALAYHVGEGDYQKFIDLMNIKAVTLGAYNTNFTNAHGLDDDAQKTTASDIAKIANALYEYDIIQTIFKTGARRLAQTNMQEERVIYTSNYLVFRKSDSRYYDYSLGGKTGFTSLSGPSLVSFAEKNGSRLLSVIYDSTMVYGENRVFDDTKKLLEWGFNEFNYMKMLDSSLPTHEIKVILSAKSDYVALKPQENITGLVPSDFDESLFNIKYDVPNEIKAPIHNGDKIGTAEAFYNGISYGKTNLLAVNDVSASSVLVVTNVIENFFTSTTFYILLSFLIVILTIAYFDPKARERRIRKRIAQASRNRRK